LVAHRLVLDVLFLVKDWQDLLAERVRELETRARPDPLVAEKARALLRVIRGYEVRVRRLALRAALRARQ
jgi:hypothetical protein